MSSAARRPITLSDDAIAALVSQRETFRRFLARRVGSAADAEDILQESLLRALQHGGHLRRGERVNAWFYRILRRAIADHFRRRGAAQRRVARLGFDLEARGENVSDAPTRDWDAALCACFEGVLPALPAHYAELLRRIDLQGERRAVVARGLGLSTGALDVALHRARTALRRRLEIFCGACSREKCLACTCQQGSRDSREKLV